MLEEWLSLEKEVCKMLDWILKKEEWFILFIFESCKYLRKMPNEITREFHIKEMSEKYEIPVSVIKTIIKFKEWNS